MLRALQTETAAPQITDLLETADYSVPQNWDAALQYGLRAAQLAARAKISVQPGSVTVAAITDSPEEKGRLETDLRRDLPTGVTLVTDISAPARLSPPSRCASSRAPKPPGSMPAPPIPRKAGTGSWRPRRRLAWPRCLPARWALAPPRPTGRWRRSRRSRPWRNWARARSRCRMPTWR
ncbi:hypothetical protein ACFSYD_04775 [Paracoccus aerius]